MQVSFKDDQSSKSAVFAVMDRAARNQRNLALHTAHALAEQEALFERVRAAYIRSPKFYKDVNIHGLTVKVYKPALGDKVSEAVHALNKSLEDTGVRMTIKPNSVTYHLDSK